MPPTMQKKFSSHVNAVGYDHSAQELHVEFKNGKVAVYKNVPPDVANHVTSAASVGSALHQHVKGQYEHTYR